MRKFFGSFWVRAVVAIAIGAAAFAIVRLQYLSLRVGADPPSEALPWACPIAGDCALPGDEARTGRPDTPGAGNDKILPPD